MASESSAWARLVGHGLAYVQDGIDDVLTWGFKRIRKVADEPAPPPPKDSNPYLQTAARAGRGLLRFLGEAGDAYYRKYGELKRVKS
jgi:hypothetical protein